MFDIYSSASTAGAPGAAAAKFAPGARIGGMGTAPSARQNQLSFCKRFAVCSTVLVLQVGLGVAMEAGGGGLAPVVEDPLLNPCSCHR